MIILKSPIVNTMLLATSVVGGLPLCFDRHFFLMKPIIGIYKITSPSKKIYIGQSIDVDKRWNKYKKLNCKEQTYLYRSLKKYGTKKHKFEVIHQCEREQLNELEKYYIDLFNTFNSKYGMNLKDGGGAKAKVSDETKLKMSLAQKGRKHSAETRLKLSLAQKGNTHNLGYKHTAETRLKMSLAQMGNISFFGKKHSDESKKKMSFFQKGKKYSPETRLKMSLARKGKTTSPETKLKLSIAGMGRVCSDETKRKISEALKGKPKSPETKLKLSLAGKGHTRNLGSKHTAETKLKMSLALKGRIFSPETKLKLSLAKKGKKRGKYKTKPNSKTSQLIFFNFY